MRNSKKKHRMGRLPMTTEQFVERCKVKFGEDRLDYSKAKYSNWDGLVVLICREHGRFAKSAGEILQSKYGCRKCGNAQRNWSARGKYKFTTEEFVKQCQLRYGMDKFDYSKVEYRGTERDVVIGCKVCGRDFIRSACGHLNCGEGCRYCILQKEKETKTLKTEEFVRRAEERWGVGKYDYSLVEYINSHSRIRFKCLKCGELKEQIANNHMSVGGCKCWRNGSC